MENTVNIKILRALLPLSGDQDIRRALNAVYVEFRDNCTIYVATNGHMLGIYTDKSRPNANTHNIIIPSETVKALKVAKANKPSAYLGTLRVDPEANTARIINPASGQDFGFTPVEGPFPDYQRIAPKEPSGEAAQYNVEYLYAFAQVNKALGSRYPGHIILRHNGNSGALIELIDANFTGVIMPFRE
jgi:DNA polymerase III sliding clamp (beta) subunit (PCNA family)